MKKIIAGVLAFLLVLMMTGSEAFAITTAEKEKIYKSALEELESYLENPGDPLHALPGIISAFESLNNFQYSRKLFYYAQILKKIDDGEFDVKYEFYLKSLISDERFCQYLGEESDYPALGAPDMLNVYGEGRKAELTGDTDAALACYQRCTGFFDSDVRSEALYMGGLDQAYKQADALLEQDKLLEAYWAFSACKNYLDSEAWLSYIVEKLGYDPATEAPIFDLHLISTTGSIRFQWNPVSGANSYVVKRRGQSGDYAIICLTTNTFYTDTSISPSAQYFYIVTAQFSSGEEIDSRELSVQAKKPLPTVTPTATPTATPRPTARPTATPLIKPTLRPTATQTVKPATADSLPGFDCTVDEYVNMCESILANASDEMWKQVPLYMSELPLAIDIEKIKRELAPVNIIDAEEGKRFQLPAFVDESWGLFIPDTRKNEGGRSFYSPEDKYVRKNEYGNYSVLLYNWLTNGNRIEVNLSYNENLQFDVCSFSYYTSDFEICLALNGYRTILWNQKRDFIDISLFTSFDNPKDYGVEAQYSSNGKLLALGYENGDYTQYHTFEDMQKIKAESQKTRPTTTPAAADQKKPEEVTITRILYETDPPNTWFSHFVRLQLFADLPNDANNIRWVISNQSPSVMIYGESSSSHSLENAESYKLTSEGVTLHGGPYIELRLFQYASTATDFDTKGYRDDGTVEYYQATVKLVYTISGVPYESYYYINEKVR